MSRGFIRVEYVLTCGADGYVRLLDGRVGDDLGAVVYEWDVAKIQAGQSCEKVPVGAMQLGCAFIKGDVPVSVGYKNGQIVVLPLPTSLNLSFTSAASALKEPIIITDIWSTRQQYNLHCRHRR